MILLGYIFYFLAALLVVYLSQYFFDNDEFSGFIKIYFAGIATAIIYRIFFGFFDALTIGKAHPLTVILKTGFVDGVLVILITALVIFFVVEFFSLISVGFTFRNITYLVFGFICGFYTWYSLYNVSILNIPDNLFDYFYLLALVIIFAVSVGYGLVKFVDGYSPLEKIGAVLIGVVAPAVVLTLFRVFYFYHNYLYFLALPAAAALLIWYLTSEIL